MVKTKCSFQTIKIRILLFEQIIYENDNLYLQWKDHPNPYI